MVRPGRSSAALPLIEAARGLARRALGIDVVAAEESLDSRGLLGTVGELLLEASDLLGLTASRFDGGERDETADGKPATEEQELSDIAMITAIALREKQRLVQHVEENTDPWEVVERCDHAIRAVAKAMTVVEHALCAYTQTASELRREEELAAALRVRPAYARMRRDIRRSELAATSLPQRILRAATSIALLVGDDAYQLVRVGDRIQLRQLQGRIRLWLQREQSNAISGWHLWQEIATVTDLLFAINRRAELRQHDAGVLQELRTRLNDGQSPIAVRELLGRLLGLDAEVDELLLGEGAASDLWLPALLRLLDEQSPLNEESRQHPHHGRGNQA